MLLPKDYLISKQFYRKKLLILTGFIIKNIKNKLLRCHVVRSQVINNFKVKEVNLVAIVRATWEVIQTSNTVLVINRWCRRKMNKIKWKWNNNNKCKKKKNNNINKKLKIYSNNNSKWRKNNQNKINNKKKKLDLKSHLLMTPHLLMTLLQLKTINNLIP